MYHTILNEKPKHLPGSSVVDDAFSVCKLVEVGWSVVKVACEAHGMYPSSIHVLKSGSGVPWIISQSLLLVSLVYSLHVFVGLSYKK